ncbi:MAG: DUF3084 domain-containing protein [Merismopedia sp. SIO2A8]|nr:DUF3084 domain-containing protein [Symploca sp. SIO2B6]NET48307.1 DUF3084 domain-containing protein [Merismopedia sp. SIO2A8]
MTSAYILIVAILVLGGLLATLGDRIGTRVGKARLSLFNLRPRQTATVVAVITGSLISASTLGILFGLSESLREGVFELDNILRKLRHTRGEVNEINHQKSLVESELAQARAQQTEVQKRLEVTNRNFEQAQTQLKKVSGQAAVLQQEIGSLLDERQELVEQRNQLNEQIVQFNGQVAQLKEQINQLNEQITQLKERVAQGEQELLKRDQTIVERNVQLAEQDQAIAKLDQKIAQRDKIIDKRQKRLQELEQQLTQKELQLDDRDQQLAQRGKQLAFLEREVATLEQYYQDYQVLRQGNVAILRGQVLASGVLRITQPEAATQAVDQLLRQANRTAMKITRYEPDNTQQPLVQITQAQAQQLINQIKDGKDYVVRILSAGNYVLGEKPIQVFADAAFNRVVFLAGDVLATSSVDSSMMTSEEIQKQLDQLLTASQFRARRAGILGDIQLEDGRTVRVIRFIEKLEQYDQPVNVSVLAQEATYTSGPLKIKLVATQDGEVVFTS